MPLHVLTAFPLWTGLGPECTSCFFWLKSCLIFSIFSLWSIYINQFSFFTAQDVRVAWVSCWGSFFTSQVFPIFRQLEWFYKPSKSLSFFISEILPQSSNRDFILSETEAKLSFCSIHFSHGYTNITFVIFVMTCCWVFMWSCSTSLTFRVSDLSWVPPFQSTTHSLYFFLPIFCALVCKAPSQILCF